LRSHELQQIHAASVFLQTSLEMILDVLRSVNFDDCCRIELKRV
jgi:hypothetical protein